MALRLRHLLHGRRRTCVDGGKGLAARPGTVLSKYHSHREVTAFGMHAPNKRRKVGRRAAAKANAAGADNIKDDSLKLRPERVKAMRNFLQHGTQTGFQLCQMHLVWAGNWAYSALQDSAFNNEVIWPGSPNPSQWVPSSLDEMAMDIGDKVAGPLKPEQVRGLSR